MKVYPKQHKTDMDKITRIRQEIGRLKMLLNDSNYYLDNSEQAVGYENALDDLNEFIGNFSEEPDKSLEEAAEKYRRESYRKSVMPNTDGPIPEYGGNVKDAFKAGAEWQEKQDLRWAGEIHKNGYNLCKEQMMKEAVEGYVTLTLTGNLTVAATIKEGDNIGIGDKVRIIVLKAEEGNK